MNTTEILALYDEQERKGGEHPSYRREETPEVVRFVSKRPERLSFVIYSQLTAENADRVIAEELAYFKTWGGKGVEWKTYNHDTPPDLPERLAAQGFEADETEGLLVLDLKDCPAVYLQPVTADVRRIGVEQVGDVTAVQEAVWGSNFDWLATQLRENLELQPDYWGIYVAYVNGKPACAAWINFPTNSQFAGLWGGSTLPEYREQGLYTAVVAARAQEAIRRGYRFLMVDASDMSRPILLKRGFKFLTYTTPFTWKNTEFDGNP
jgi:GNAT superfamily N-acetyltransferase